METHPRTRPAPPKTRLQWIRRNRNFEAALVALMGEHWRDNLNEGLGKIAQELFRDSCNSTVTLVYIKLLFQLISELYDCPKRPHLSKATVPGSSGPCQLSMLPNLDNALFHRTEHIDPNGWRRGPILTCSSIRYGLGMPQA